MLYHEQVFGNVFERRESKCCAALMKHRRKVKGEQVIKIQMAQQLKTKNINVVPRNYFAASVKPNFCQRPPNCIDNQDKVESVTDTDNEFTECQTRRKKLQNQLAFHLSA